jgi:hypothetical protein
MHVSAECLADTKTSDAAITRLDCPEPERTKLEGGRERIEVQRRESEGVH